MTAVCCFQDNLKIEQSLNKRQAKKLHGEPVTYGQVVQLQHIQSKTFISQENTRAENRASAMRLYFHTGDDTSAWQMLPGYKSNKIGEVGLTLTLTPSL